jgi:hypothetical protein
MIRMIITDVYVVAYPKGVMVPIVIRVVQSGVNGGLNKMMSDLINVMIIIKNQM